jgi:hypothetical protein
MKKIVIIAILALMPFIGSAQTIPQLQQWLPSGNFLIPRSSTINVGTSTTNYFGDGSNLTGITLTLPQDINTTSSPTFAGLTLTGLSGLIKATAGVLGNAISGTDYIATTTGDWLGTWQSNSPSSFLKPTWLSNVFGGGYNLFNLNDIGSSSARINKIWANDADFTNSTIGTLTISSVAVGDLIVNNGNIDIASSTKEYKIGGSSVLNSSTLGSGITISSLKQLGTITTGTWNGTAIADLYISSASTWNAKQDAISFPIPVASTSLTAGRSLTLSTDTINADTELYTIDGGFDWATATTTYNPVHQRRFTSSSTLTYFECRTDGATIVIGADERASSTPQTAGTDIFTGGSFTCSGTKNSTTTFSNSNIDALNYMSFDIDSNSSSTAKLNVNFTYLK